MEPGFRGSLLVICVGFVRSAIFFSGYILIAFFGIQNVHYYPAAGLLDFVGDCGSRGAELAATGIKPSDFRMVRRDCTERTSPFWCSLQR
uniref:Uncharacterized protein n=1 Tax=Salmonella sp. TaxID=599 RepID=A0A482EVA0_SALSP|nr:hypothetical protein NNIBIDOC_00029 [Salmonella sp.]